MSVESKIRELLNKKQLSEEVLDEKVAGDTTNPKQGSSEDASPEGEMGASKGKDTSIPGKVAGDQTQPRQGSSQDATVSGERDDDTANPGAKEASSISQDDLMSHSGTVGDAPNFKTVADPASVVNQPSSKGNVAQEETEEEGEMIEEDFTADLATLFDGNEDLSEEFRGKASSLFEAMVTARVSNQVQQIEEGLIAEAAELMEEFKADLTEKVDSYLSYVIEKWVEDNQLAVENGLRTDIAESFINGMKNLFAEHYIDVPEEKYDVLGEMQAQLEEVSAKLDEAIAANVELHNSNVELMKEGVFAVVAEDLAKTDAEKFKSLVADVEFENAEIYEEKLNVIKENYYPASKSTIISEDKLEDEGVELVDESTVNKYVEALNKMAQK
jgi:hypothetical protein